MRQLLGRITVGITLSVVLLLVLQQSISDKTPQTRLNAELISAFDCPEGSDAFRCLCNPQTLADKEGISLEDAKNFTVYCCADEEKAFLDRMKDTTNPQEADKAYQELMTFLQEYQKTEGDEKNREEWLKTNCGTDSCEGCNKYVELSGGSAGSNPSSQNTSSEGGGSSGGGASTGGGGSSAGGGGDKSSAGRGRSSAGGSSSSEEGLSSSEEESSSSIGASSRGGAGSSLPAGSSSSAGNSSSGDNSSSSEGSSSSEDSSSSSSSSEESSSSSDSFSSKNAYFVICDKVDPVGYCCAIPTTDNNLKCEKPIRPDGCESTGTDPGRGDNKKGKWFLASATGRESDNAKNSCKATGGPSANNNPVECKPTCGDGEVNEADGEECDEGKSNEESDKKAKNLTKADICTGPNCQKPFNIPGAISHTAPPLKDPDAEHNLGNAWLQNLVDTTCTSKCKNTPKTACEIAKNKLDGLGGAERRYQALKMETCWYPEDDGWVRNGNWGELDQEVTDLDGGIMTPLNKYESSRFLKGYNVALRFGAPRGVLEGEQAALPQSLGRFMYASLLVADEKMEGNPTNANNGEKNPEKPVDTNKPLCAELGEKCTSGSVQGCTSDLDCANNVGVNQVCYKAMGGNDFKICTVNDDCPNKSGLCGRKYPPCCDAGMQAPANPNREMECKSYDVKNGVQTTFRCVVGKREQGGGGGAGLTGYNPPNLGDGRQAGGGGSKSSSKSSSSKSSSQSSGMSGSDGSGGSNGSGGSSGGSNGSTGSDSSSSGGSSKSSRSSGMPECCKYQNPVFNALTGEWFCQKGELLDGMCRDCSACFSSSSSRSSSLQDCCRYTNSIVNGETGEIFCQDGELQPDGRCRNCNACYSSSRSSRSSSASRSRKCGNALIEIGEDCDNGSICGAGDAAGRCCSENADCSVYRGPCIGGFCSTKTTVTCGSDGDCIEEYPCVFDSASDPTCSTQCKRTTGSSSSHASASFSSSSSSSTSSSSSSTPPFCGNGVVNSGEQCDDGNQMIGDGCNASCRRESTHGQPVCGNGVQEIYEQCDDGNLQAGDGCDVRCRLESTVITGTPQCGDGRLNPGEECDDGNRRDFDGCSATCFLEKGSCGDGIIQQALGEQCEPSLARPPAESVPYGCGINCRFTLNFCGNGLLDPGEQCDAGSRLNSNQPDALCRTDCSLPRCGDRIMDSGEQCDDGNNKSGDGCDRFCLREGGAPGSVCGNGRLESGEECDDGNRVIGDGCNASCRKEPACEPANRTCGDGIRGCLEECDDGNRANGDGCSATCRLEGPSSSMIAASSSPQLPQQQASVASKGPQLAILRAYSLATSRTQSIPGQTGPAAVAVMAAGAAAGFSWMRQKRKR
ncbi:MAG: DUF4215 domain-containing protein [Candidatus Peribacteraceae bacterium]|nr:DUF4215 domain-containing protein [Candidatus Peribacteraceae bacterium]MDD5742713.1 DUF4215 domain-containing protein [Candidatus Peribacteraceae bacterium]